MKYDFASIENLVLVRSTLKKLVKKLSQIHYSIVCQTNIKNISSKFREISKFFAEYEKSEEYTFLQDYIDSCQCPHFFKRIDDEFLASLKQRTYTLQEILSILKKISLTIDEIEQEIININEKYFF